MMFSAARILPSTRLAAGRRLFHASAPAFVSVGDKLPAVDLVEGSPGNKVNLTKELTGKGVIIGRYRETDLIRVQILTMVSTT
jgi:2-Cys peroxiredoxin 5